MEDRDTNLSEYLSKKLPPLKVSVITIFPEFLVSTQRFGVVSRALRAGRAFVEAIDLRTFATDRHRTVDDRPFGGGEGMVLKPEPVTAAIESLGIGPKGKRDAGREAVILLSAQGKPFTQLMAREFSTFERIVLVCGRFEGVDERVNELLCDYELSIGDYVLSGGELAAAVIVDAVIRLIPGVLGNADSVHYESFGLPCDTARSANDPPSAAAASAGLLDYPHYTRPADFRGLSVPNVLANGDHQAVRRWRRQQALRKTLQNRPDLLRGARLSAADREYLATLAYHTDAWKDRR